MQGYRLIKKTLGTPGFSAAQVALATLGTHNLTATGNMESALGTFVCLNLWHLVFALSLPLSYFSGSLVAIV